MFWPTLLLSVVAVPACLAAPSHEPSKRAAITGGTLYAYGTNISGLPVLYDATHGQGALYIAAANTTALQSITWDIPGMSTTGLTSGTLLNGTLVGDMYIDTSGDLFDSVVLTGSASNGTISGTSGMTTYGKQLVYNNGSSILSEFWAQPISNTDGTNTVWALHWNSNNEYRHGAMPVVLKTIAPSSK